MTVNFIVRTAAGAPIYSTPCADLALKRARESREEFPGVYVESITVTTMTRRLWTDRKAMEKAA